MDRQHPYQLHVPVSATDHIRGPEHAPVTLVEFGDYECPNCLQAAPAVSMILRRHGNRLRFVYRHFPLEEIHPHALLAAEAAEAAHAQGHFWDMHDLMLAHFGQLSPIALRAYADRLGLDRVRFDAELDDEIYRQRIREHQQSGRDSGVRSTPAFFLNGRLFDVSYGLHTLADGVADLLVEKD
jgi:protein-disulfide isomerase